MPHKDPELRKAYHRAYQQKHRERLAASAAFRYQRDRVERIEYTKKWYSDHPERVKAYRRQAWLAAPWKRLIKTAQERAVKKRVPFSLTNEWGAATWTGLCAITDLPFDMNKVGCGPGPNSPTIDRKNPKLGYTPDNCCFVLHCVNSFKHDGTIEEMVLIARRIVEKYPHISMA